MVWYILGILLYIAIGVIVSRYYLKKLYRFYGFLDAFDVLIGALVCILWAGLVAMFAIGYSVLLPGKKIATYLEKKWSVDK